MTIGKLIQRFFLYCFNLIPTVIQLFFEYFLCEPNTRAKNLSSVQSACSFLPEDVIINIICRLPVKSLLRCRSVCKTWHHIIATPSFAKNHFTYQKASYPSKYLLYEEGRRCTLLTDDEPLFDTTKHSKLYYTHQLFRKDVTSNNRKLNVHGVCNGLLCLSDESYQIDNAIYLWNPICRKAKKLPQLIMDGCDSCPRACMSFGYYDDDHKVVVLAPVGQKYIVSVYSLSTDSWKTINTNFFSDSVKKIVSNPAAKFVDGVSYMLVTYTSRVDLVSEVVRFNLSDETIRVIESPEAGTRIEAYGETISVLGREDNYITMWILRDKSSSSTSHWEKKFSIELKEEMAQAVGFLNNGKYLFQTFTNLYLCDVECAKLTEFRTIEFEYKFNPQTLYQTFSGKVHSNFVESLLLLNEDSVHPFVKSETGSCSSMLLTLEP